MLEVICHIQFKVLNLFTSTVIHTATTRIINQKKKKYIKKSDDMDEKGDC